jgi:hypothetical protein
MGIGISHRVVGLHPDLEVRALEGLHRQLHGGGWRRGQPEAGEARLRSAPASVRGLAV